MKTALIFLAALVALVSPLRAEVVESYITIALKFHFNTTEDALIKGDSASLAYNTVSLKNKDFIDAIGAIKNISFLSSAQLIRRTTFDADGEPTEGAIYIRDKVQGLIDVTENFNFETLGGVAKYKYSRSKGTGSYQGIFSTAFAFSADPADTDSEQADVVGLDRVTISTVLYKGNFVQLENFTSTVQGYAFFFAPKYDYYEGLIEGTVKVSGAKGVITPK